jgi:pimeloyl-ACP methyl ester carboxylesterase
VDYPSDSAERFFDDFIERTRHAPAFASALYAASVRHKVKTGAVAGIFRSMVDLSDNGALMDKFLALPMPRMFMYGQQNASLSYLPTLRERGVRLAEIPGCGHFSMYSNPVLMWRAIEEAVSSVQP